MKRIILTTLTFLTLLVAGDIRAEALAEISPTTFDFGYVTQNKLLTRHFWIKSIGDETLKIKGIFPGCGCTQIPLPDSSVAPGDSMMLTISFSTSRFQGPVEKTPTVTTNVNSRPAKLFILANVVPGVENDGPLQMEPEILDVSQFNSRTRRQARFQVTNTSNQDLDLIVTDSSLKSFEVKLPGKIKAGETVEGKIRVFEDKVDTDFKESLTITALRVDLPSGTRDVAYSLPIKRIYRPDSRAAK